MMEHSTSNISSICRNARLSLQKAGLSRRSHMLSEELEHLRDFESLVSETLPRHPLFSSRREDKELLELDSYLLDVRERLAELECKHPFLYKHHRKGGNSFHGFNSKSKRLKDAPERYKPQEEKLWSSAVLTTTRPPSSSSSSSAVAPYRKGLPGDYGRQSPPTPSKRSISASCSRSPSLRSISSSSLGIRSLKRSLALRSPLSSFVDYKVFPSEELELPSQSSVCRDSYEDELRFSSHKSLLSLDSLKHRPDHVGHAVRISSSKLTRSLDTAKTKFNYEKYVNEAGFSTHKTKLPSDNAFKSNLGKNVDEAGFSSHKFKLPSFHDRAKCRSSITTCANDLGSPSPAAPAKPFVNARSSWNGQTSNTGDDTGKNVLEGFAGHNDVSESADLLDSSSFYKDITRQRLRNPAGGRRSRRGHDSSESLLQSNDDISLLHLASQTIHGMRASSKPSQKRSSHLRLKGVEKRRTDAFDAMRSSFEDVDLILEGCGDNRDAQRRTRRIGKEAERNKLETERTLAGLAFTENLEAALKRPGSLQESDGSLEETRTFRNDEIASSRHLKMEVTERMSINAEQPRCAGPGSRRALFGKDGSGEGARGVNFQDNQIWVETAGMLEHCEDDEANSDLEDHRKPERETDLSLAEKSLAESSMHWEEDRALQLADVITIEDKLQVDYEVGKAISEIGNMGSSSMMADISKRVKFEKWAADPLLDGSKSFEQTQPEAEGASLEGRHFSAGRNDDLKLSVKPFVGKQSNLHHSDGEGLEGLANSKLPCTTSQLQSHSHDALSSSFSSSASCTTVPYVHSSLGRLSPPWDSSKDTSSNLVSDEIDHHHHKDSSDLQQVTFCNPVFDFDSSKAYAASNLRPRLDICDTNEERLKSIRGECAYVASELKSFGEVALDKGSNGSVTDIYKSSRVRSSTAEPKMRGDSLHYEDVSDITYDARDISHVYELTQRMDTFQRMLNELKETVEGSSLRVQEQVDICEAKVKGMERQLDNVKLETNSELLGLKRFVKAQLESKVQGGGSKRASDDSGSLEKKTGAGTEECSSQFDALQKQVDSWMSRIRIEMRRQIEEAVVRSIEKFGSSIKADMEKLELQRLRDLGNLKKEMGLKLSLHESKEQLNKISEKQLDLIVEDVLGKQFSHMVEMFSAEKEKEFGQIKSELVHLREEYEVQVKARAGVQEHMETMTQLKQQLHSIRTEGLQVKFLVDGMKKETDAHVHDIRLSMDKLKVEAIDCRERILGLEERLKEGQQSDPKKAVMKLHKQRTNRSLT